MLGPHFFTRANGDGFYGCPQGTSSEDDSSERDAQERLRDLLDAALEGHEQLTADDLKALGELAKDLAEEAEDEDEDEDD